MFYVAGVLALVVLILFWFDRDFSVRGKLIATAIYLVLWAIDFVVPFGTPVSHLVFGLALYFIMYPSGWGNR